MKQVTFGAQGFKAETPKGVKQVYRLLMLLSTLWVMTIQPQFDFSDHVVAEVNKWLVVGNGLFYTICQFFGWSDNAGDAGSSSNAGVPVAILLLLGCALGFTACHTTKTITSKDAATVISHEDSTVAKQETKTASNTEASATKETKDSAIVVPGNEVGLDLSNTEVEPVTDASGEKTDKTFRADKGSIHAEVTVKKDGSLNVRCKSDSLVLVIKGLQREIYYINQRFDSTVFGLTYKEKQSDTTTTTTTTVVKQEQSGWLLAMWEWVKGILAVIGGGWLVVVGIKRFLIA